MKRKAKLVYMSEINTIISNIKNGSEKSFNQLYNLWVSRLYSFVYHYIKSESITDDIIQETFYQLWINRQKLDPNKSIQALIFTISYHLILKELRRQVNNPLIKEYLSCEENFITTANESAKKLEFDQFQDKLEIAKEKLTPRQREIFNLNKECNFSVKEIAEKLSISEQVVRNQLSTALKIIREDLKQYKSLLILLFIDFLE